MYNHSTVSFSPAYYIRLKFLIIVHHQKAIFAVQVSARVLFFRLFKMAMLVNTNPGQGFNNVFLF